MPYTLANTPAWVKKLPKHGQDIWVAAFNAALKEYKDESKAFATAASAVKKAGYKMGKESRLTITEAAWDVKTVNNLPDSAFAVIKDGGKKDAGGKTAPRSLRMLPHHDSGGGIDLPHLRNALARVAQPGTSLDDAQRASAKKHLQAHAKSALKEQVQGSLQDQLDSVQSELWEWLDDNCPMGTSGRIVAIYADYAICMLDEVPYKIPYTVDAEGDVQLGEPEAGELAFGGANTQNGNPPMGEERLEHHYPDGTLDMERVAFWYLYANDGELSHLEEHLHEGRLAAIAEAIPTQLIAEMVDFQESLQGEDPYTVNDVTLIQPGWNMDKTRYYSKEVLGQSAQMWEGARAFANHDFSQPFSRSIWEQVGYYTGIYQDNRGRLRAKVFNLVGAEDKKQHIAEWIGETRKTGKPLIGASIVALGKSHFGEAEGHKGNIIDSIETAYSVDVVSDPGAGGGYNVLMNSRTFTASVLESLTFEDWRDLVPTNTDRLKEELKTVRQDTAIKDKEAQLEEKLTEIADKEGQITLLREELAKAEESSASIAEERDSVSAELTAVKHQRLAEQLLTESRIPSVLYEDLMPLLLEKQSQEEMETVIALEVTKIEKLNAPVKPEGAGQAAETTSRSEQFGETMLGVGSKKWPGPNETAEDYKARILKGD